MEIMGNISVDDSLNKKVVKRFNFYNLFNQVGGVWFYKSLNEQFK